MLESNVSIEDLSFKGNKYVSQNLKETLEQEVRMNMLIKEFTLEVDNKPSGRRFALKDIDH